MAPQCINLSDKLPFGETPGCSEEDIRQFLKQEKYTASRISQLLSATQGAKSTSQESRAALQKRQLTQNSEATSFDDAVHRGVLGELNNR